MSGPKANSEFGIRNAEFLFSWLLNSVYLAAILLALPWLIYQRLRHGKYRDGWDAKFWGQVPLRQGAAPCIWFHAVSVGEVNLLEPILSRWERAHPDWECVISTTTQAGYQLALKRYAPRTVVYCPLDFSWAVKRAMQRIRPTLLVLCELELWPNLVAAARAYGVKVAVINGRLGDNSFRGYRRIHWLVSPVLKQIHLVAAQNQEYADRFLALGAPAGVVRITGSIKFDGARTRRDTSQVRQLAGLAGIAEGDIVFLAGSTQDPEERLALDVFERLANDFPRLKLILVPRHPERFDEVARLLDERGAAWCRRSSLPSANALSASGGRKAPGSNAIAIRAQKYREADTSRLPSSHVLLVDAVGELGQWWGTARIAFVGGSLTTRGGQNMIEPAGYGAAISFGPNTWNFRDVVALLLAKNAAVVVHNGEQLEAFVRRCLSEPEYAEDLGRRAQELVLQQQGAADRTIGLLDALVVSSGSQKQAA